MGFDIAIFYNKRRFPKKDFLTSLFEILSKIQNPKFGIIDVCYLKIIE